MKDSGAFKRLLSLILVFSVFLGIVVFAHEDEVLADSVDMSTELPSADSVISDEFESGNGIYKIFTNTSVAFMGLADPDVKSFSVPAVVSYKDKKYKVSWIAQSAFEDNTTIQTIYVGKNVGRICSKAFAGCTSLITVNGGKGVSYVAVDAYENCKSLKKLKRYYKRTYNVGLRYTGRPKPWRSKKVKAGRNGRAEYTWITDNDLKTLGMSRETFAKKVLDACKKMSGTMYSSQENCICYCLSAYAKALGVAKSVGKGRSFKISFARNYKTNSKTKYAVNLMKKKKLVSVHGNSIAKNGTNWYHCTYFAEHMLKKPDCYGGVRVADYGTLGDCMKALHAQPGDIVLFGGYVVTYLCKDGKFHKNPYQGGGKKKVKGHYVRGEGNLFLWGHATIYCGQNYTHRDNKGKMRTGQWYYETNNKGRSGLHWREPFYYAGDTNVRVMVIHVGNPSTQTEKSFEDPVVKALGNEAVPGAKYGFYRSEDDASKDTNRLCTYTCGSTTDIPEINLGRARTYDITSGKMRARFYVRQLSDTGMLLPDKKAYIIRIGPANERDLATGWIRLGS